MEPEKLDDDEVDPTASFAVWDAAREIPIDLLVLTHWNVNEMSKSSFDELVEDIDRTGFDEPCQVVPITTGEDSGKFLVVGGEHRYKACKVIGKKTVPCIVKDHLDPNDEEDMMLYSVRRNNVRGKINAQKYAELEQKISKRKKISVEVARKRMMIRGQALKSLRKVAAVAENEDDETEKGGRKSKTEKTPSPDDPAPSPLRSSAERQKLLANLRALEQEILLKCETIEHGYIFFGQGGHNHLVVQESSHLYKLVEQLAAMCKRDSVKINEFLTSAIAKELKDWEK